jgi:signal transduction histidine kinase
MTTIAYQPITLAGEFLWSLYISTPHSLASNVGYLINQQKNFSTIVIIVVGSMAFGIAFLILSWNKRLEGAVESRTVQLKKTNESLTESNSLLASANKQLEIHDNMQKEFINVAAHELRTPIMPILGEGRINRK